ncbi:uncharacterized protein YALI1_C02374g [Yarrowia lipolytica]|uniref:Uncharacterized protein n=1 Tax=Yarrowia lipolytica TaxID=4952 RepID=A0A1D8N994_YARLL|nr:hypothetical protein YALI1_C02374g [Yarrowia lipolytica]
MWSAPKRWQESRTSDNNDSRRTAQVRTTHCSLKLNVGRLKECTKTNPDIPGQSQVHQYACTRIRNITHYHQVYTKRVVANYWLTTLLSHL